MGTILELANADFSKNKVSVVKQGEFYNQQDFTQAAVPYTRTEKYASIAWENDNTIANVIGKQVNCAKVRVHTTGTITAYKISSNVATQLTTVQVTADDVTKGYVIITWNELITISSSNYVAFAPSGSLMYNTSARNAGYGFGNFDPSNNTWAESKAKSFTIFIDFGKVY